MVFDTRARKIARVSHGSESILRDNAEKPSQVDKSGPRGQD